MGGETPDLFLALYGTWRVTMLRPSTTEALGSAPVGGSRDPQRERHARRRGPPRARHDALLRGRGRPRPRAPRAGDRLRGAARRSHELIDELLDVTDPWIACHAYQAWALVEGRPEGGRRRMIDRAMVSAGDFGHPFTRALTALGLRAWLPSSSRATRRRRAAGGRRARPRDRAGLRFWIGWDEIMQGWAWAAGGRHAEGWRRCGGARALACVGSELGTAYFLTGCSPYRSPPRAT